MKILKFLSNPLVILVLMIAALYWQFFLLGKIPVPTDTMVGSYFPWLDYKWGFTTGVPVKNPPISDVFSQTFPWKYLAIDMIKQGILPLWNSYSFSGTPFLATYQSSVLFPFNIVLLLPKYFGWGIYIFLQTLFAAVGMYLLLGRYIKNSAARIGGGLVFSLSGLMTTWLELGVIVWAAAMLPWCFYFLASYYSFQKVRFLSLLTISLVCLILAGNAQITVFGYALLGLFILYKLIFDRSLPLLNILLPIFFASLAIVISLVQLLPTIDLLNVSIRNNETYNRIFNFGLSPWFESIRLISADFFGNPTTYNAWGGLEYHEYSSFLGTLTIPLIIPLLFNKFRTKLISFWFFVLLVCLLLAFDNPLSHWLYSFDIPLLTYSYASRIFFVLSFVAGILIGFGLNNFAQDKTYRKLVRFAALILLFILAAIYLQINLFKNSALNVTNDKLLVELHQNAVVAMRNLLVPIMLLVFLFVLSFLNFLKKFLIVILILVIFLDLGRYFVKHTPFVPQNIIFPNTPVIDFLQNQPGLFRIGRADYGIMTPNTWIPYKLQSVEGYDPMMLESYARFFKLINNTSYYDRVNRFSELDYYPSKYLDALNTKYFLAVKRDEKGLVPGDLLNAKVNNSNYKKVFEDKSSVVLENPDAKNRVYYVSKVTSFNNQSDLVQKLSSKDFDPTIEALVIDSQNQADLVTNGKATIIEYTPNKVKINTNTDQKGFLILADSYDKNWQLLMNNAPQKLYQVNGTLRGFEVPEGTNSFVLNYWPKSFDLGLKLSIVGLVSLLLVNIYAFAKKEW